MIANGDVAKHDDVISFLITAQFATLGTQVGTLIHFYQ
jgi:hypothetical protein